MGWQLRMCLAIDLGILYDLYRNINGPKKGKITILSIKAQYGIDTTK